jgi:hypothetical protein
MQQWRVPRPQPHQIVGVYSRNQKHRQPDRAETRKANGVSDDRNCGVSIRVWAPDDAEDLGRNASGIGSANIERNGHEQQLQDR